MRSMISRILSSSRCILHTQHSPTINRTAQRCICDVAILRMDSHENERRRHIGRLRDPDGFWLRIFEKQEQGTIYEEDLKMAWYVAVEEHLPTLTQLTEKFMSDKRSSFGSFRFSPLIARTCYLFGKPDVAAEIFKHPVISKSFDDSTTIITFMDLFIETGYYAEAIYAYEWLQKVEWSFVLRHPLVPILYSIALYKQETPEALAKALDLARKTLLRLKYKQKVEDTAAALALKLIQPESAVPLVLKRMRTSELAWNMKVQADILMNKLDLVFKEINRMKQFRLYDDTVALLQSADPKYADKVQVNTTKTVVEDEIMAPLRYQDHEDILGMPRKRFHGKS